jgi:hypothetical protein
MSHTSKFPSKILGTTQAEKMALRGIFRPVRGEVTGD